MTPYEYRHDTARHLYSHESEPVYDQTYDYGLDPIDPGSPYSIEY